MNSLKLLAEKILRDAGICNDDVGRGTCGGRINAMMIYLQHLDRSTEWLSRYVSVVSTTSFNYPPAEHLQLPWAAMGERGNLAQWAVCRSNADIIEDAAENVLAEIPSDWEPRHFDGVQSFPVSVETLKALADALNDKDLLDRMGHHEEIHDDKTTSHLRLDTSCNRP